MWAAQARNSSSSLIIIMLLDLCAVAVSASLPLDAMEENANEKDDEDHDDNDDSSIELPVLEHGYREVPMEWAELRGVIEREEWSRLTRSIEQQRTYEVFKRRARRRWRSLHDCVYVLLGLRPGFGIHGRPSQRRFGRVVVVCQAHPPDAKLVSLVSTKAVRQVPIRKSHGRRHGLALRARRAAAAGASRRRRCGLGAG
jgi:hypothetical protein